MVDYTTTGRTASTMKPMLLALTGAFVLGAGLAGYGVYRWSGANTASPAAADAPVRNPQAAGPADDPVLPTPTPSAAATRAAAQASQAVERVAEQQGGIDQRLVAAEQRLARLDMQSQAAAGNVARAEGLLIAFSARRAIEKGRPLNFLGDQLRLRFGDALPNAVRTLIENARNPVTLDALIARLDTLAPELAVADRQFSWALVRSELSHLFVIRRESTNSPQPRRRLERARYALESGRVEDAVKEVRQLPGAENAADWIADAERYAASQDALDRIEASAVLEPRLLRDGTGARVEQPSIAERPQG